MGDLGFNPSFGIFTPEGSQHLYQLDPRNETAVHRVELGDGVFLDFPVTHCGLRNPSWAVLQALGGNLSQTLRTLVLWDVELVFPPKPGHKIVRGSETYVVKRVDPKLYGNKYDCQCVKEVGDGS